MKLNHDGKATRLFKKVNGKVVESSSLGDIFTNWQDNDEAILIVIPHDDDAVLGIGMFMQQLIAEDVPLAVAITTDGRSGYTSLKQRDSIIEVRKREAEQSFKTIGIDSSHVVWLGYPDGDLWRYRGRRVAEPGDPTSPEGFTGLEDALVRTFRKGIEHKGKSFPITRVIVPSPSDYHNDHVVTAEQIPISLFHAIGDIWPELGAPLPNLPHLYYFCVYCDFPLGEEANILLAGSGEFFQRKIEAIKAYVSQTQIASLIRGVEAAGPYELMKEVQFRLVDRQEQMLKFMEE